MKRLLIFIYIILFALPAFPAIEVVELPMAKSNKVVVKLMFKAGSICDPKGKEGLTLLTANTVMDGGTKSLTSSQVKDFVYPMAAEYYGSVDKEVIYFTFQVHKDFLDNFYTILKGLVLTPRMDSTDFERNKSNQLNYVEQVIKTSSDEDYGKLALEDNLFKGTNYQSMVRGTSSGLRNCNLEDIKNQYKNFFTANNVIIGIAGAYSQAFLATLKADMQQLSSVKPVIPVAGTARKTDGIEVEIIQKDKALGSAISAGFALPVTRKNNDFAALMIANSWLGEHRKSYSLLYRKIREERSMNYGDYSYIEWYNNGGQNMLPRPGYPRSSNYFSIWIRPVQTATGLKKQYDELRDIKIGHAHFALRMALSQMQNLIERGMGEKDFELTKTFLRSYIKLYAQTPEQKLGYMMDSHFYGRDNWLTEVDGLLENVTYSDMMLAMRNYWQTQNMVITIVTDKSEALPLKESLEQNSISPMSYSNALKAVLTPEILTEDKIVAEYKLNIKQVTIVNSNELFK